MLFVINVCAPIETLSAMLKWTKAPDKPPIWKFLPITVEPAIAQDAAIAEFFPRITLWAIWTWLSSLTPSLISVFPKAPLSIVQLAPISTFSSINNFPICSILMYPSFDGAYPNPSEPRTLPWWIIEFLPTETSCAREQFALIITLSWRMQSGPIKTFAPIDTFSPIMQLFEITADGWTEWVFSSKEDFLNKVLSIA